MARLHRDEMNALVENEFVLDCQSMFLRQRIEDNPKKYQGVGMIYQNSDGGINFKIYVTGESDNNHMSNTNGIAMGVLVSTEDYYSLEAIDIRGRKWMADWIILDITSGHGKVITNGTDLKQLEFIDKTFLTSKAKISSLYIIFPGHFNFPYNTYIETEKTKSLSKYKAIVAGECLTITKLGEFNKLYTTVPHGYEVGNYSDLLIEALSIAMGREIVPLIISNTAKSNVQTLVYSKTHSSLDYELDEPIPCSRYWMRGENILTKFLNSYVKVIKKPHSVFFGYWVRILKTTNLLNQALVLTVAIEGIIKEHYFKLGLPDKEFVKQVNDAKLKIKDIDIGKRARGRINSTLNSAITSKNTKQPNVQLNHLKKGIH